MSKRIKVSDDLSIRDWPMNPKAGLTITSNFKASDIDVSAAELPALLGRLQEAAEAMGVATKQGEMMKALGLAVEYMTTIACDPNHLVLTECHKALASVKR